jgi:hypothetical protein
MEGVKNAVAGAIFLYVVAANLATVTSFEPPTGIDWVGTNLYVKQRWGMFAPQPSVRDGWWIAPARLRDGSMVDLYSGREGVDRAKPALVSHTFSTGRWRKYMSNLVSNPDYREHIVPYARYLRRRWDDHHDPARAVAWMQVCYLEEDTQPDFAPPRRHDLVLYEWDGRRERAPALERGRTRGPPLTCWRGHEEEGAAPGDRAAGGPDPGA